ncbi:DUF3168 domain-containing protein [Sphingomonas sp. BN140010]|uniref:DUF3168 domain-containing protein n=1 Tax=Sphingomonas arvum TaxID=2992113 RepID=A0ABT3JHQ5_9SPHN|nr:DUF3168 domain-containing protein [Sphingomonas sp. BN140010]MCW3798621.1 DUF3168 domain-containing protein [Sphingomonas sp. BN140010]
MSSAGQALQAALVSRFSLLSDLSGIYDGPPARAAFPYLVVDAGTEGDWSTKTEVGREVAVALTLWDDQPARLQALADRVADAMTADLEPVGWSLVTCRLLKRRVLRDVAGPWAAAIDYRARLFALA